MVAYFFVPVVLHIVSAKSLDKFWTAGEPKVFLVNAKNGGEGTLNVLSNRIDLETKIENENGFYTATLTPHTKGQHRVVLMYGGVDIPGGTFDFEVFLLKLNVVYYECWAYK